MSSFLHRTPTTKTALLFLVATIIALSSSSYGFLISSTTKPILTSSHRLYGIQEWRDQAYEEHYTLEAYQQANTDQQQPKIPATVPILPFPFTDILMQGQRKQLNLYEKRFHDLFTDAMDNHHGMVGMGLLLGQGMITTMPLCEIESFTRLGNVDDNEYVDKGDGMGNGSIFVTIRAVSRAKIAEDDLMQETPYFKAKVVEVTDEPVSLEVEDNVGLKEKGNGGNKVLGESSPIQVGSLVASTIENLMVSLSSMEHKLNEVKATKKEATTGTITTTPQKKDGAVANNEDNDDREMNTRLEAARLEELFMKDSTEGVDLESNASSENDEEEEEDDDDEDEDDLDVVDRVTQFETAFESAKESDNQGYILQPSTATDNLSSSNKNDNVLRTPKDLTAISWAAFCTGEPDNVQRQAIQIQALDMTNVIQRLQLASAMLREEQMSLKAKLALAGIKDGDSGDGNDESL